jgi:tetratricopeptide (TPR) repeat protein
MTKILLFILLTYLQSFYSIACLIPASKANQTQPMTQLEPKFDGFPLACHVEAAMKINHLAEKAQILAKLSEHYVEAGHKHKALQLLEQAVEIAKTTTTDSSTFNKYQPAPWRMIVEAYLAAGEYERAIKLVKTWRYAYTKTLYWR